MTGGGPQQRCQHQPSLQVQRQQRVVRQPAQRRAQERQQGQPVVGIGEQRQQRRQVQHLLGLEEAAAAHHVVRDAGALQRQGVALKVCIPSQQHHHIAQPLALLPQGEDAAGQELRFALDGHHGDEQALLIVAGVIARLGLGIAD